MSRLTTTEKPVTAADVDPDDQAAVAGFRARRLAQARKLAEKAVSDLRAAGILDKDGKLVAGEVPADMRPDSKTDV
jgi:hypothetical protein